MNDVTKVPPRRAANRPLMRRLATIAVSVALVASAFAAPDADGRSAHAVWSGRYSVIADGQMAGGWLAYPVDIVPDTLLVFGHGCCGPLEERWADRFALHHARDHGMVAVAMDYRGNAGWNVGSGHADLIAATEDLRRRFPIRRTIAWGVSMGGEVTGMAVAARPDLFDYWISSMGVLDLPTQWAQQTFRGLIEAETGGPPTPEHRPAYDRRSPVELAAQMRGIERAYLLHGVADTAVPASQSQQMYDRLVDVGVPATHYTLGSGGVPAVWWPVRWSVSAPIGPAGHDWSTIALAEAIIRDVVAGRPPDHGTPARQRVAP